MAISKKYRRKIVVNDRCFFWFVTENWSYIEAGWRFVLSIISEDKHFNVSYGLGQLEAYRYLVSMGSEFPLKNGGTRKGYQRVRCPQWEKDGAVTPAIVRQIIEWSSTYDPNAIKVDWKGRPSTSGFLCQNLSDEELSEMYDRR
ncbi:hypothetical protein H6F67_06195 [Microcoleus sp. FACHB-1515]|uniref:hypothetical protein n=1 Tax=Cyanophyceae TaxID=3028117 RepID=UPI001684EAE2|nr:hypothetical protein [Microcoleus sp. FACHB-1515]MBD2089441.1 hypothetical protein [Microcoleus sp. FACHB-1515]